MRRAALACILLLSGCSGSGFWRYERDTLTLPGANPNRPISDSENYLRSRGAKVGDTGPMLTEAGDVWPGPPAAVPTLKDLQKQQLAETSGTAGDNTPVLAPLPTLPSLPGYEIQPQEPGHAAPPQLFGGNVVDVPGRRGTQSLTDRALRQSGTPEANGPIIVPNGNGTSTVISPTGGVSTIPTPK